MNIVVGARFHAALLARTLLKYQKDVHIYSSSPEKKWDIEDEKAKRVHFVPLVANIFTAITKISLPNSFREASVKLFDLMTSLIIRKADIVHVWSSFGLYTIKKAKKNGSIVFVEKSCPHPNFQNKLLNEEAKKLGVERKQYSKSFDKRAIQEFELADKIVVCSNYTLESFLSEGISRDKLYNVALDANFTPKRTYNRDFDKDSLVVGMVGGSVIRKGFLYLLQAWKELDIPNKKLLLKASINDLKQVECIWSLIDGDDTIEVLGYQKDMEDFYERCDLFVLPSIDEGFGMVVFEALACSLPVIVTKNVGAGDFLTDGYESFIVDIRDSEQIREKIDLLNGDRVLMKTMSDNAKRTFDGYQMRPDTYTSRLLKLYSTEE
ncbi:glycosyltransferase family 4 protein [Vibrio coralliilyticus]|uniref:glycosyltransferase family 4 protein n=1 Tax=Vibrio coralliilyticus TaxID=190893 RepID=UPI001C0FE33D